MKVHQEGKLPAELQVIWVAVSGLQRRDKAPMLLFERERRREMLARIMDEINSEYGDLTVYPAHLHRARAQVVWNAANRGMYRDLKVAG